MTSCTLESARFVHEAVNSGCSWDDLLNDTDKVAQTLGIDPNLPEVSYIKYLATDDNIKQKHGLSADAVDFFQKVAVDGRFIDSWKDDKRGTASSLGIILKPEVEGELDNIDFDGVFADAVPEGYVACAAVALAVVVGAVLANGDEVSTPVFDFAPDGRL